MTTDVERRLDRLEAYEQIRQLAARYALALDSRDVPTLVSLFVDDVEAGGGKKGREAGRGPGMAGIRGRRL